MLSYGKKLEKGIRPLNPLPDVTQITITKEDLGVDSLENVYFKIYLFDQEYEDTLTTALYSFNVENNKDQHDYSARTLKQELDNLNYYDGILQSLNEKSAFREANDFFFNYLEFLEKKLNGNNFIQHIKHSREPISVSDKCE